MWNKLNIDVTENGNQVTKTLYYDTRAFRDENAINNVIDNLLNNIPQHNAFLADGLVVTYINKLCDEAYEAGKKQGNEEMKERVVREVTLMKI